MKSFVASLVLASIAVVSAVSVVDVPATVTADVVQAFSNFQEKFDKKYGSNDEWARRLSIFAQNLQKVNNQNAEHLLIGGDAVFGITKFSDMTPEEFKAQYLTYIPRNSSIKYVTPVLESALAADVDWRTKAAVTPVKDQAQCGSCWAFSATEAIESYAFLSGKYDLLKLSPQQITSCDKTDLGCNGGNTETAYNYVQEAGGLEDSASYPYTSGTGRSGTCKFNEADIKVKITGFTSITKGEKHLQTALNNGPVSICVAADAFQSYSSGVLKSCPGQIDHCVQAVGYSTSGNYWLVRNSWGASWGEDGFIRVAMGRDLCHIADDVTFPTF